MTYYVTNDDRIKAIRDAAEKVHGWSGDSYHMERLREQIREAQAGWEGCGGGTAVSRCDVRINGPFVEVVLTHDDGTHWILAGEGAARG